MALPEITDANFQAEVTDSPEPVLVDFWAPWCGPCKMVGPVLEEIDGERSDVKIVKLNVDDNQSIAQRFGVRGIPTLMLFRNGAVVGTSVGALSKSQLALFLDSHL